MGNGNQRLDALQARVSQALRDLPGATALYLFGSRRTAPDDPYADLDLQLLTDDLPATRRVWPHALARVAPIALAWPLTPAPDNTAFAILFEGESLYHKLDVGLSPASERGTYAAPDAPYTPLWEQPASRREVALPATQAYLPPVGTVGHALFDDLLGSVRYLKARKRRQHLTCWRFMRGKPDLLLRLLVEQQGGWRADAPALSTWDYKALDQRLPETMRAPHGRFALDRPQRPTLLVSRGVGYGDLPVRLFAPSDVLLVTLHWKQLPANARRN